MIDGNVSTERAPIAVHDRFQYVLPTVRRTHVARTQRAASQITELVEHEQWMIADAAEVAAVDCPLSLAIGRAHARIHVEHNIVRRTMAVNAVDPSTGGASEHGEVLIAREPIRLEASHLAG